MATETQATETDPVCGMQVWPDRAAGKSEYDGRTYYFCSLGCMAKFDKNPSEFTSRKTA